MPRAVVRWYSSTTTWPSRSPSTPASSASSRSPLGTRPVATSSTSPRTVEPSSQRRASTPSPSWPRAGHLAVVADLPLLGRDVGEPLADVVVVPRSSVLPRIISVTRLPSAEKMWANSHGDEAAADDDQMLRHVGDPHDGVAGVVAAHRSRLIASGTDGARARGDHHLIGGELVAVVGAQRVAAVGLRRRRTGCGCRTPRRSATSAGSSRRPSRSGRCGRTRARRCRSSGRRRRARRPRIALTRGRFGRPRRRRRTSWSGCSRR